MQTSPSIRNALPSCTRGLFYTGYTTSTWDQVPDKSRLPYVDYDMYTSFYSITSSTTAILDVEPLRVRSTRTLFIVVYLKTATSWCDASCDPALCFTGVHCFSLRFDLGRFHESSRGILRELITTTAYRRPAVKIATTSMYGGI